jgi:16S rRNA (cytosine967-C5)-methyltransferase
VSRPKVDAARKVAYDVLKAVRLDGAYANLVLPELLRRADLSGRDAAFATELVSGTLRWQGTYDAIIDACLTKPRLEAKVRDVLRLGAHQLLAMRVPDHAAIATSVDLTRATIGVGPAGLVNAVLRKIASNDLAGWVSHVAPDRSVNRVAHLAVAYSHPTWIVETLAESLAASSHNAHEPGADSDQMEDLLVADNAAPSVSLVARPGRATRDELPGEPTRWSPYGVTLTAGDPADISAVKEQRAGVQDEGSQLVAIALAKARLVGRDERWLDLCAGPGGKAALLSALAHQAGARLVANEQQPHRAELVRRALAGARGVEQITVEDGTALPDTELWGERSYDRVLVDAPCSGLGALRRRPEARWRKRPDDLPGLTDLQSRLLDSALRLVRPGGVVLYATCSPVLVETRDVVQGALDTHPDVRLAPIDLDVADSAGPLPQTRQLWPHRHGTDAMFLALLRRDG